jgi:hypothetical protein
MVRVFFQVLSLHIGYIDAIVHLVDLWKVKRRYIRPAGVFCPVLSNEKMDDLSNHVIATGSLGNVERSSPKYDQRFHIYKRSRPSPKICFESSPSNSPSTPYIPKNTNNHNEVLHDDLRLDQRWLRHRGAASGLYASEA